MKPETRIFFKSPKGKKRKRKLQSELNKQVPNIIHTINKIIQKDNFCYGIFYKKLDNKIFNQIGYHLNIFYDFENLNFYYSIHRLEDKKLLKTLIINLKYS